jgi:hypothetical protein
VRTQLEQGSGLAEYTGNAAHPTVAYFREDNFQPSNFQVWPLGAGRYWLNEVDPTRYDQPAEEQLVETTLPEGTFRLWASGYGRQLQLQQRAADGRWQPLITLQPGVLADSLAKAHAKQNEPTYHLPTANLTLRGQRGTTKLQLFLRQVNRLQRDDIVFLHYEAQALLEFNQ